MKLSKKELHILLNGLAYYRKYRVNDTVITDEELDEVARKIIEEISKKSIDESRQSVL